MVMIGSVNGFDDHLVIINLTKPTYPTEIIPLTQTTTGGKPGTRIVDIAFDPLTRDLYGVDIIDFKLVKISLSSGVIRDDLYPISNEKANIAALFFDVFGNLYGYGAIGSGGTEFGMYRINKNSGQLDFATVGPSTGGVDGCSCPFNISMQKTVYPKVAFQCTDVFYTFRIANGSQSRQADIIVEDRLPDGFIIEEIVQNPFGGTILSGVGTNYLLIEDLEIPSGQDSIVLRVNVGTKPPGTYGNLAHLKNLPENLGLSRLSDNPETLRFSAGDSTYVTIMPPVFSFEEIDGICQGDTIQLKASLPGAEYLWQDGSTDSSILVTTPGTYSVTATTDCDVYMASTTIDEQTIQVTFDSEVLSITLGDAVVLEPVINNSGDELNFSWIDPIENSLSCLTCENPFAQPVSSSNYVVHVTNEYGCRSQAEISLEVKVNRDVYTANIFSPNNDGLNDFFYLQSPGTIDIEYFRIFDRWGNQLFESINSVTNMPDAGWNGLYKNENAIAGVYTWAASIKFLDGVQTDLSGSVTIIR